jgi:Zinc-binding dehydrogenase
VLLGRSIRHPLLVIEPGVSKTSSPSGSRTVASVTGPRGVGCVTRRGGPPRPRAASRLSVASTKNVVGIDFAGVAERVPAGDHGLRAGDRIFGMARTHGSYAEYTAVAPVLDLVNGPDTIRRDAEVIRPGGRLVSTIFAADEGWFADRQITAHNHASSANPLISPEGLTTVAQMLADGRITARIRSTVDLDAAGQVLDELRHGGLRGKAVIRLLARTRPGIHRRSSPGGSGRCPVTRVARRCCRAASPRC